MPYKTSLMDMVYPDEAGRPCALQFRIALTASTERLAIVHLLETKAEYQGPMESSIVRDQILNRILDTHLRGVPLNAIRLVVESGEQSSLFPWISMWATTSSAAIRTSRHISPRSDCSGKVLSSGPRPPSPGIHEYTPATQSH